MEKRLSENCYRRPSVSAPWRKQLNLFFVVLLLRFFFGSCVCVRVSARVCCLAVWAPTAFHALAGCKKAATAKKTNPLPALLSRAMGLRQKGKKPA